MVCRQTKFADTWSHWQSWQCSFFLINRLFSVRLCICQISKTDHLRQGATLPSISNDSLCPTVAFQRDALLFGSVHAILAHTYTCDCPPQPQTQEMIRTDEISQVHFHFCSPSVAWTSSSIYISGMLGYFCRVLGFLTDTGMSHAGALY